MAFLTSMNPVFSGLLSLRFVTTMLPHNDAEQYLWEGDLVPNEMKGLYLSNDVMGNLNWIIVAIYSIIAIGFILLGIYYLADWLSPATDTDNQPN